MCNPIRGTRVTRRPAVYFRGVSGVSRWPRRPIHYDSLMLSLDRLSRVPAGPRLPRSTGAAGPAAFVRLQNLAWHRRNDRMASVNLIRAGVAGGVKRFIFSSSAAVYGIPAVVPVSEDMP